MAFIFFILVGLSMIAFLIFVSKVIANSDERRPRFVANVGSKLGLTFCVDGANLLTHWHQRFPLFCAGESRHINNVLHGRFRDANVQFFDFSYLHEDQLHQQSVIAFSLQHKGIPTFSMWPGMGLFSSAIKPRENDEFVQLPEHAKFASRYRLYSKYPNAVKLLFHPKIVKHLDKCTEWSVEGGGTWLVIYRPNIRFKPNQLKDQLWQAYQIYRAFQLDPQRLESLEFAANHPDANKIKDT